MTQYQFFADIIDQLDLALDQLSVKDRNFDRFAMMLVDNVVELILHQHAKDKSYENELYKRIQKEKHDSKLVQNALGQTFDAKLKLARNVKLLQDDIADSILYLHSFRNTSYHKGLRHEGILHSLTLFYFKNACELLKNYTPYSWSKGSADVISYRSMKYIGNKPDFLNYQDNFSFAWDRLASIADGMGITLINDLTNDMEETIDSVDMTINFIAENSPERMSRKKTILHSQSWAIAFTDEGKKFAKENGCVAETIGSYVQWIEDNYKWTFTDDPIPGWKRRLNSLQRENNLHAGLKKYADFMKQTENIREILEESLSTLDVYIQSLIDESRGK